MTTMLDDSTTFNDEKDPMIWFTATGAPVGIRRSVVASVIPQQRGNTFIQDAWGRGAVVDQSPEEVRTRLRFGV